MELHDLEAWIREILRLVAAGNSWEDNRVELKRELPEPEKVVKQLAGHANAARSPTILWLFGVDDRTGEIPGVMEADLQQWTAQVAKPFDDLAPTIRQTLRVHWHGAGVTGVLFDVSRRPYVVKRESRRIVYWRPGDRTIEAGRGELLELLVEAVHTPTFEVLEGRLVADSGRDAHVSLTLTLYQEQRLDHPAVMPFHRATVELDSGLDEVGTVQLTISSLEPDLRTVHPGWPLRSPRIVRHGDQPSGPAIIVPAQQLEVDGPVRVNLEATRWDPPFEIASVSHREIAEWTVRVRLPVIDGGTATLSTTLRRVLPEPNYDQSRSVWVVAK